MDNAIIKLILSITFISILFSSYSQDEVKWSFSFDSETNRVLFTADLKPEWHLYSQFIDENLGPIPTTFEFSDNENVSRVGEVKENNVKTVFDENFGGNLDIIEGKAVFSQEVTLNKPTIFKGSILFMLCDDK